MPTERLLRAWLGACTLTAWGCTQTGAPTDSTPTGGQATAGAASGGASGSVGVGGAAGSGTAGDAAFGGNEAGGMTGTAGGGAGGMAPAAEVDPTTMTAKHLFGYQGWFACPGDGSPRNRWVHWFRNNTPTAENAT